MPGTPHPTLSRLAATAVAIASLLVACAPTAAGAAARVEYRHGATFAVTAGSTLYVTLDLSLEEAGLREEGIRRSDFNWVPLGIRGDSANATRLVSLSSLEAPEGWQVRSWQTRLLRERPLGDREGAFGYRLESELRVDVPASAEGLLRRIRGELVVAGGATLPVDFLVRAE